MCQERLLLTSPLTFKSKRSISPPFGNLVQMLSARQSNFKLLFKLKMKLRPNVMGEQHKSKLKFQQLRLFKPAQPQTPALW